MEKNLKPILVLGATGKTGSRVAERLEELQIPLRKGSRTADPKFDWESPDTWEKTLEGIDSVYITFQPDLAIPGAAEAIESFVKLAKKAGVQKLVLLSGRGEEEAQQCENIIINSGLEWTIVRASWFNQNFSESYLLEPILAGHVSLPVDQVREPFIDADDIAAVVVAALTDEKHNFKLYEVTGPRLLSFREAIGEIATATGLEIQYHPVSMREFANELTSAQVPQEVIGLLTYLFTEVMDGRNQSIANGIEQALGRKPKDFADYIKESIASRKWEKQPTGL